MKAKKFWVKVRHNPQLGDYCVPCGQLSIKEAKAKEKCCYGFNQMIPFDTKEEYKNFLLSKGVKTDEL